MDFTLIFLIGAWIFCAIWIPMTIATNSKRHPKALFILFFAEMWERFSYYGMRALLTLYMAGVLFKSLGTQEADIKALTVYGSYTALVYLFPVIGGLIADRFFGFRRAIIFGGILMMLGHFALAMEGLLFEGNIPLFYLSLALIIVGNGYFKPNISSFLGQFYEDEKYKLEKDGAYNIFYMGINVGAFLASLTCGYLGERVGWHWGFGAAGVGMLFGLLVFLFNQKALGTRGLVQEAGKMKFAGLSRNLLITIGSILFIPLVASMLNLNKFFETLLFVVGGLILLGLLIYGFTEKEKAKGQRLWVVMVLFIFNVLWWALFEQAGGSLTIFTRDNVDRVLFGSEIPTSVFQALNAFFIIVLATTFTWMWRSLSKRNAEPSTPMKFVLGFLQLALGFGIVVLASKFFNVDGKIPMIFIVLMYLFHTTGELSLSPVGLSMITKLSPAKSVGLVMGIWFFSFAMANKTASIIGKLAAGNESLGEGATLTDSMNAYVATYQFWGVLVLLGAALLLFLLVPFLKKWMHGIH